MIYGAMLGGGTSLPSEDPLFHRKDPVETNKKIKIKKGKNEAIKTTKICK